MGAAREKDQADFDLERFIDMFDEAMTSKDPRVIETLRSLMMIVTLTRPEASSEHGRNYGPLRRLFDDMHNLNRSVGRMQEEINDMRFKERNYNRNPWDTPDKYTMAAASQMAQSIDNDIMNQVSKDWALKINGATWPKGKL
jgi:hypothetical protein